MIEDGANFGGYVGVHQFVRVGRMAMIGGISKVVQDVPPFMMADGRPCEVVGLNVRGLRRAGVSAQSRADLKQAYKLLYRSQLNTSQALEAIDAETQPGLERDYLLDFVRQIRFGSNGRQNDAPRI
jgi:UDP-N-acetylglucosamine acyltransferase